MSERRAEIMHNTWVAGALVSMVTFFGLLFSEHSNLSVWAALASLVCFGLVLLGPSPSRHLDG